MWVKQACLTERDAPHYRGPRHIWALCGRDAPLWPRWEVFAVRGNRTRTTPDGIYYRARRDNVVMRASTRGPRVLSWRSLQAAQTAVEKLAGLA